MASKLLMVDDDPELIETFKRSVSLESGWEFHGALGAADAWKRIRDLRPDVVILDYDLGPGEKNGLEFLKELRHDAEFARIPVLLFTGVMMDTADRAAGLDLGADDYVLKPVSPPILLAKATAAIRRAKGS